MTLPRTIRWRPVDGDGLEHLDIVASTDGIRARSTVIGSFEEEAFGAAYTVDLAADWTFRALELIRTDGRRLTITRSPAGDWQLDGQPAPQFSGCIDIDISVTPFTNTLPIRRARLERDVPQRFSMVWIPLDGLVPFVDAQIYTRLADGRVHYAAADGSFSAELTVDGDGFVVDYPGLFHRA